MPDHSDDPPAETPIQRALRLRKAALAAKPKTPDAAAFNRKSASGVAAGASKPWMKR